MDEFTLQDCLEVNRIYASRKRGSFNRLIYSLCPKKKMQLELNVALCKYKLAKISECSPTETQLRNEHIRALTLTKKLHDLIRLKSEDVHFWGAVVSAKAKGQAPYEMDDKIYDQSLQDIETTVTKIDQSLEWLVDSLSLCTKEDFHYWDAKDSSKRKKPENIFIQDLSKVLDDHFEIGGFWRGEHSNPNSAKGWRIDCLDFLLKRVGVSKTKNQILEAVN